MIKISLVIVSAFAGLWNILRDVTGNIRHKITVFMLGFSFCYGSAIVAEYYGFSSEVAAFFGYVCGVLSNQIYDALTRIIQRSPDIMHYKIRGKKDDGDNI